MTHYAHYQCSFCMLVRRDSFEQQGKMVCSQCAADHEDLESLYQEIVRVRSQYSHLTINQLFRKMWNSLQPSAIISQSRKEERR